MTTSIPRPNARRVILYDRAPTRYHRYHTVLSYGLVQVFSTDNRQADEIVMYMNDLCTLLPSFVFLQITPQTLLNNPSFLPPDHSKDSKTPLEPTQYT